MAKKNNNKSAIRKDSDKKVSRLNRAIYSATDPTYGYPTGLGIPAVGGRAGVALFNPDDMWYEVTDSVADAAWRKRLGLSYDDKFLIENKNGSFRLPKDVEIEIPTDTTALKRRIQANKKLADSPEIMGDDWKLVQGMIDADEKTLKALRRTYETGEPVVINEYSHNSRKLAKDGKIIEGADNYKSPLNVLQNYTVQYNPKNRTMMYRDTYDFNGFESFVPGEPFDIEGEIPLNRKYFIGGLLEGAKGLNDNLTTKFIGSSLGKGLSSIGVKSGGLGGIANTAATAIGGLLAGKNTTGVGKAMQGIGSLASNIPGVGGLIGAGVNLVGGLVNAAFGSNINKEFVNQTEAQARQQSNYVSGASDNAALLSDWSSLSFLGDINKSDVGSDGWFSNKARRETNRLNTLVDEANMRALASISNTAENIDKQNDLMLMANYSAYGGPIDMKYTGVMSPFGNQFKDGGIYIKPSKRGTFTAAAKKRGMGVQEFASKVLANKEDYSPAMVKKANFARNASKWKHADGGPLEEGNSSNSNDKNKRTYIGGTTSDARKKYLNWDKELTQIATNLAASYGISPSLVIDRLSHEGLVDRLIKDNNEYLSHNGDPNYPSDAFDMDDYNEPYGLLGLDNIFDTYTKGITKTKRPINMIRQVNRNERGENVNSAETKNLYDTLELFVAELASRRNQVRKQYPNLTDAELDSATSARYNASNKYFKQLMDSGEYKTKYPINVKDINIPAPTKTNSKYIQDQVQSINKSDVLNAFEDYHYFGNDLIDESIFTVRNKSYNPGLFMNEENYEFDSDSPLVDRFVDNYVNRNFTIPSKVKVVDDYYEGDGKDKMYLNKKAEGGNLFTNGVTFINNGDTHENNPLEGVRIGVDENNIPNLVEEGEVIYDDYVFSNRLRVPKEVKQKYKLRGVTFADAAKQLQKESEERPNDPISKRGLNAAMAMLQQEQETVRMKKESNKYANGGRVNKYDNGSWLRYAPIAGHAIGVFSDLFSSPDYSAAEAIEAVDITPATVGYTPVGNYLSYKPFDRDYYLNKLNADVAASRRAVTNTSGGNRAAAMAGLLAADYNYGNQLGTLARQAEEYNQALRERVEGFNRQTNLANAEMGLKAAMANAESRNQATKLRLSQAGQVAAMRKAAKDAYDARRSNNINVLLEELGGLGTENWNRDWLDRLAKAGVLKIDSKGNPVISSAKGGKIRTKKKKGFTYG